MVRFKLRVHPKQRLMYIPMNLLGVIGMNPVAIPNHSVAVLYNSETDPVMVVKGVEHILRGLRLELKAKTPPRQPT